MSKIEMPPLPPVVAHMHSNGDVCAERRPEASIWPVDLVDASELRARDRQIVELCASIISTGDYCRYVEHAQGCCDCVEMAAAIRSLLDEKKGNE